MRRALNASIRPAALAALGTMFVFSLLMAGCGKSPSGSDNAGAKMTGAKKTSTPPPQETTAAMTGQPNQFLSVFSTNDPRDPFNPKLKPKTAAATALTGAQKESEQAQLTAALQAGFQGIYGSPEGYEVMVHGVLLQEKRLRPASVAVMVDGRSRTLKVKATRVYRNAAELQVEGLPQKVIVPKPRR